jgi:hypothetical protein
MAGLPVELVVAIVNSTICTHVFKPSKGGGQGCLLLLAANAFLCNSEHLDLEHKAERIGNSNHPSGPSLPTTCYL